MEIHSNFANSKPTRTQKEIHAFLVEVVSLLWLRVNAIGGEALVEGRRERQK